MDWIFFVDLLGGWQWECRAGGVVTKESSRSFPTRDACMLDACLHGFREEPFGSPTSDILRPTPM